MILYPTDLKGLLLVELESHKDERGAFAEVFNIRSSRRAGLASEVDQVNFSTSKLAGTFRGLHYQVSPNPQTKTVFCIRGKIIDIAVDLRRDSQTYLKNYKAVLDENCGFGLYIPRGFAHGWYSLEPDSQIMYLVNGLWSKSDERGIRYDDPAIKLKIPGEVMTIQERDRNWPLLPAFSDPDDHPDRAHDER